MLLVDRKITGPEMEPSANTRGSDSRVLHEKLIEEHSEKVSRGMSTCPNCAVGH